MALPPASNLQADKRLEKQCLPTSQNAVSNKCSDGDIILEKPIVIARTPQVVDQRSRGLDDWTKKVDRPLQVWQMDQKRHACMQATADKAMLSPTSICLRRHSKPRN